jgi:tripartite-type tricarboxylate transporter receptor subunit TctC
MSNLSIVRLLLIITIVLISGFAAAQDYPTKPIRWVVPFPPGGPTDLLARTVGQKLSETWGQPIIIENKPGAGGNLGVDLAAKSPGDGYTLVIVPTGNITVNPTLFANLPYKPSDLAPVTMLATVENVLVVNASVSARSLADLVTLAKSNPGVLTFASPGAGSQAHLAGELMKLAAGIDLLHVPYRGVGPALNDLVGGHVSMMFSQMSSALPHIQSGALRALGVASLKRSMVMGELPTIAEQGFPGFEATSWYALMVPAGSPKDVITKLHAETVRILHLPDVKEKLAGLGADPVGNSPEELAATIREESERWAEVIRKQGIKLD